MKDQKDFTFVMQTKGTDLIEALMKRASAHIAAIKKQVLMTLILLVACTTSIFAQGWEVTFGGNKEDLGVAIIQTIDEGYIEVGHSESFGSDNDLDIYVVRTDVDGTLVWSNIYDEGNVEQASDIIQLEDESFLVLGFINEVDGIQGTLPEQVYLIKLSPTGELLWTKRFENNDLSQRGKKIIPTTDGGYAIVGTTETVDNHNDALLIKLDANIEEEWRQTYGGQFSDLGRGLAQVEDGYILASNSKPDMSPDSDVAIYHLDENGDIISHELYGTSNDNEAINDLIKTDDGIIFVGSSDNFNNGYIIKSDFNGDTLWTREVNASDYDDILNGLTVTKDGSLVAVGQSVPTPSTVAVLLVKFSPEGEVIWQRILGDEFDNNQYGEDIIATIDDGLAIAAYSGASIASLINDLTIIKLDGEGNFYTNLLEGKVFWSEDGCNPYQLGDLELSDWLIEVQGENTRFVGSTDEEGYYKIPVDVGDYTVQLLPKNYTWDVCSPNSFPVSFTTTYDTLEYNFPVRSAANSCPVLTIETSVAYLESCQTANYTISYCNDGSADAEDVLITLILDDELTFSDAEITPLSINEDTLIFSINDLASTECGSFTLNADVECSGIIDGQAVMMTASIEPDTLCATPNPDWDGANISVHGRCEDNQIFFTVRNNGINALQNTLDYIITEDVVMFLQGNIPSGELEAGEEIALTGPIPANPTGSTYRVIAMQSPGAPSNLYPTVAVEGCVAEGSSTYQTGVVSQFPENDQDPYIDIDVQEISNTNGVANTMIGHPKGYQDSIITPSTDIEYTLLFANTTVDTLNRLVIRDTLPTTLELSSLSIGPASHPYSYELYNSGVLKITFNDLNLLPSDGSGDNADSRGFIKYSLSQKQNLSLGTVINNQAAVYFDYTAPILTNVVRHVVACEDFLQTGCITVDTQEPFVEGVNIRILPNPLHSSAEFIIEGCECTKVEMIVRDAIGREIRREQYAGSSFTFQRRDLVPALYFFELRTEGQTLQTGKLLIH